MAGSLAPFALAAEQFPLIPLLSEVVVWRASSTAANSSSNYALTIRCLDYDGGI